MNLYIPKLFWICVFLHDPSNFFRNIVYIFNSFKKLRANFKQVFNDVNWHPGGFCTFFFLVIKHFYLVLYLHFKLHLIHYRMSNRGKILKTQFPYRTTWTYIFPSWFEYVFLHDPSEFFNSIVHFLNKLRADFKQVFLKMIIGIQLASVHFF